MKFVKIALLALGLFVTSGVPAMAQDKSQEAYAASTKYPFSDTRALAAGVIILAAAMGIGMIAKAAVESMARQPEVAGQINTSMIIAAALIEGVTFFALIIVLLQRAY